MKNICNNIFTICLLLLTIAVNAQNPYASLGVETKVLTLSEGRYDEFFPNKEFIDIGSVRLNTVTGEVVAFLEPELDTIDYSFDPAVATRFLSVDPIGRMYPELTPYQFASNTPIAAIDLDGLEADLKFEVEIAKQVAPKLGITTEEFLRETTPGVDLSAISKKVDDFNSTRVGLINAQRFLQDGEEPSVLQKAGSTVTAFNLHFGNFTSQNDVSVLSTGQNFDGTQASGVDKTLAVIFVSLPISGSGVKNVYKQLIATEPAMQSTKKIASMIEDFKTAANQDEFNKMFLGSNPGGGPAKIIDNPIDGNNYIIDGHHRLQAAEKASTGYSIPIQKVDLHETGFESYQDIIDAANNY